MVAVRTAARARAGSMRRQQQCKSGGNMATTAARMMAREMQQDKGNAATMMGYCGDSGGRVNSNGGGKSNSSAALTTGYGGDSGGSPRCEFGKNLVHRRPHCRCRPH
jgi:hypothetical protein